MRKKFLVATVLIIPMITSGCVSFKTNQGPEGVDGGIFKTVNKGAGWQQKTLIPTVSGQPRSFAGVNVASLAVDPGDNQALYFGSEGNGLFYSYDGAETWRPAGTLPRATISSVVVDPADKCVIFATIGNQVYKSVDCSRTWDAVYHDNQVTTVVNDIAIDHFNSNLVYIGLSRGDIVKSFNGGLEWQTIYRTNSRVRMVVIDPNDSRNIYVVTQGRGVYRSADSGENWEELKSLQDAVRDQRLNMDIKAFDISLSGEQGKTIVVATKAGILRSTDNGETWEKVELIPTENVANINDLEINPNNPAEIYYVTNTTFFRSLDGGENWSTFKLPTARWGWKLLVDPEQVNVIYMGVKGMSR